ncbi:GntR family transcriptional regulator [Pseudomonas sp. FSL R10-0056]|uniref:GntR family transcriptional regulator n=1 Tax=Pseudomonas fragi TaxID=296 RepID=A0ABT4WS06_PSEFR|nr:MULTISPECIES: GntR family transcriptional regulator [Pseudomonas]MQT64591.1 GntR family transcriptional regulator [Pseudomonas sp. FSL R10-0056]MQT70350.1 GntR family transcriptional regulator [Pseudomonas sp. FSL R10-0071]MQU49298.1 GntR family transcriptional regulator [Pseudomonas sp. FSL A6-1183]NMY54042.1 GntR family transcriptional regulator [Pseudomonas sp. WS 5051]MDA7022827.1 GntR family transcriptional regulator [Pseudomonas fragi]
MAVKNNPLNSIVVSGPIPAHLARSEIEETLRNAILDGRLPCGTAIRQEALAKLFGVSRMPVREALRQLEAQGLLQVVQYKGAVVAPLIEDNSLETYELRQLLEAQALRLSVPLLSKEDFEEAEGYIEALEIEKDFGKIGTLNRQFHQALYCKAPNKKLLALIESGLIEEERFLRFNLEQMNLGKLCQDDHRALLRYARARDVEACIAELELHLQRGVKAITYYLSMVKTKQP